MVKYANNYLKVIFLNSLLSIIKMKDVLFGIKKYCKSAKSECIENLPNFFFLKTSFECGF